MRSIRGVPMRDGPGSRRLGVPALAAGRPGRLASRIPRDLGGMVLPWWSGVSACSDSGQSGYCQWCGECALSTLAPQVSKGHR
jgi:hypothetical protein